VARETVHGRVPEGEPTHALLEHIASLNPGQRLWFERGVLAGDTVVVPHEALFDTPAFLVVPRLRRRFRCTVREAAGLAELFLALDASPAVVAHYEDEARRVGVARIIGDLVHLVASIALVEQVPECDALRDVQSLGDDVQWVDDGGRVAQSPMHSDGEGAARDVQWHALGTVQPQRMTCPVCGAGYEADQDAADLPTCPGCGARDTWEARQGGRFRGIVGAIDGCRSLEALAALGKRLYTLGLSHDQAGVAWMHYRLCKQALEAQVVLGQPARGLLAAVEQANPRALGQVGATLYRSQHAGSRAVTAPEWRRIWPADHARRAARALSGGQQTEAQRLLAVIANASVDDRGRRRPSPDAEALGSRLRPGGADDGGARSASCARERPVAPALTPASIKPDSCHGASRLPSARDVARDVTGS
jgi:hypothetical protein